MIWAVGREKSKGGEMVIRKGQKGRGYKRRKHRRGGEDQKKADSKESNYSSRRAPSPSVKSYKPKEGTKGMWTK